VDHVGKAPGPRAPHKPEYAEVGAIVLLLVGGLIVPLVGWLIGVVLLWVSNAWNVRDKIIGTFFVPGGLGLAGFIILLAGLTGGSSGSCDIDPSTGREFNCMESGSAPDFVDALVMGSFSQSSSHPSSPRLI
jgi:hypothetical protein